MPTYVYRNLVTQETFEVKQSMKDAAFTQHPETGEPVKRLVSAPAIAFKGSGFYANDSRAAGKSSSASTSDSTKTSSSKAEGGSEGSSAKGSDTAAATPKAEAAKPAEKSAASTPAKSAAGAGGSNQ